MSDAGFDTITFLSDRGQAGEWVGVIHSILRQLAPQAAVIDLSHSVGVDDVRGGGLMLARSVQYLAPGVIVVAVGVDHDPQTDLVAVEAAGGNAVFVGPDNGVLAAAVAMVGGAERAVRLDQTEVHLESPGARDGTRDVLAPVAAQLCAGTDLADLGSAVEASRLRPGLMPLPSLEGDRLTAEVLAVGHRGELQLNVELEELTPWGDRVSLGVGGRTRVARRVGHHSELSVGELGYAVDSHAMVAIVATGASAAEALDVAAGDQVIIEPVDDDGVSAADGSPVTQRVELRTERNES